MFGGCFALCPCLFSPDAEAKQKNLLKRQKDREKVGKMQKQQNLRKSTVVTSYGGDDGNTSEYENAVASYQEATGNTVMDASATSNEEWKAKVLTDFGNRVPRRPDVFILLHKRRC